MSAQQGIKLDVGKSAVDLIDPYFTEEVGKVLTYGATKYAVDNWRRGMAIGKAMAGVGRHCLEILKGNYVDPETGFSHMAHAACGLMFVHYFVRKEMLSVPDDRWKAVQ